jgi:hypothetical protein
VSLRLQWNARAYAENFLPGVLGALVVRAVAEALAFRAEVAVAALVVLADSVPLAVRGEVTGPALVILADSVTAIGIEVALASRDLTVSDGHEREQGDAGNDGKGDK